MGASRNLILSNPSPFLVPAEGTPGFQILNLSEAKGTMSVLEETTDPEIFNDVTSEYQFSTTKTAFYPAFYSNSDYDFNLGYTTTEGQLEYYIYNMFQGLTWQVYTDSETGLPANELAFEIAAIPKDNSAGLNTLIAEFAIEVIQPPDNNSSDDPMDNEETFLDPLRPYSNNVKNLNDAVKLDEGLVELPSHPLEFTGDDLVITLDARTIMYKPSTLNEILDHKFKSY
jgi:hypothetical protein|tara:strand:- start:1005 stop:1688 length:684 start_codon:yes stop_codon:yes gene_type:complete